MIAFLNIGGIHVAVEHIVAIDEQCSSGCNVHVAGHDEPFWCRTMTAHEVIGQIAAALGGSGVTLPTMDERG